MPMQKQILDVRFQGLDQKANPRTTAAGTVIDGANWTMNKDGRIEKRPGCAALAMLDVDGAALVGRELTALGDELVLRTAKKWYARNPQSGVWNHRGRAGFERMLIRPVVATGADCNGVDSRLELGAAQIGTTRLTVMAGGPSTSSATEGGWLLTDATTGENLVPRQYVSDYRCIEVGTDGTQFTCFAANGGTLLCGVWAADHRSVTWATVVTDLAQFYDPATYTIQQFGVATPSFATLRVASGAWLIAYVDSTGAAIVRRVTRSGTTFTAGSASTLATGFTQSVALGWAYTSGATAYLCGALGSTLYYGSVATATGVVSGSAPYAPTPLSTWTGTYPTYHAVAGFVTDATYFLIDATKDGTRTVWLWIATGATIAIAVRDAGLLTQPWYPTAPETNEINVGIAYPSTWQPSSVILRMAVANSAVTWRTFAAHIHNGNFAGTPMRQKAPAFNGILPIGILNNPISPGGPGTVSVSMVEFPADTNVEVSQPAEVDGTLVCPGAILKAYDGAQVTEAAFVVGPETVAAVEGSFGQGFVLGSDGVLTTPENQQLASGTLSRSLTTGLAEFVLETPVGTPGLTEWPAGTIALSFWLRIVNPVGGHSYTLNESSPGIAGTLQTSVTNSGYQLDTMASAALSGSWTHITRSTTVPLIPSPGHDTPPTAADKLRWTVRVSATPGETATVELSFGGDMPVSVSTPFPILETGVRQYAVCAAWTDSRGRIQRSQVCPATSSTNDHGFTNQVTVPMLSLTDRSATARIFSNADSWSPVTIEVYRTAVNSTIFYRVATVPNVPNGDPVVVTDMTNDEDAAASEQLYTTGGVVMNWPPIGCTLVASHQGRVFVATADNQVFFSAYAQGGEALAFAAEYQVTTNHIPGDLIALLSLDDKLVIATETGEASLSGNGPEPTGLPSYDSPMLIGSQIGPISQRACARIPDGWIMSTPHGVYLLDRGLSLNFFGMAVVVDSPDATDWTAAIYDPLAGRLRMAAANGIVLVYDFITPGPPSRTGQWFRWTSALVTVAWAVSSGLLYQLSSSGTVYQCDSGLTDAGTNFQEWVKLSLTSPAGVGAWARVFAGELTADVAAGATLKLVLTGDEGMISDDTMTVAGGVGGAKRIPFKPRYGKVSALTMWLGESAASATAGVTLDAIALEVGSVGGVGRLPVTSRPTRS